MNLSVSFSVRSTCLGLAYIVSYNIIWQKNIMHAYGITMYICTCLLLLLLLLLIILLLLLSQHIDHIIGHYFVHLVHFCAKPIPLKLKNNWTFVFQKGKKPKSKRFGNPRVFLKNMDISRKRASTKKASLSRTNLTVV